MATLGIDLGGTFARAAVVEIDGRILASAKIALTDRQPASVVAAIAEASREALRLAAIPVEGVGVGVAGQLVRDSGIVAVAPNLGWRDVPFGQLLTNALGRPVRVVNDLTAAAWGELKAGAGRGASNVYVVYVGSGVGSAIIVQGQKMTGATGVAGELGHIKVEPGGRRCGCGELGCLEAYAGGHNLIALMREAVAGPDRTLLRDLTGGDPLRLNPALLEQAATAGDPVARAIYDRAVGYLGLAIANQITVLNPERLILGGGVLNNAPGMKRGIADAVQRYASATSRAAVEVVHAALGDDSGLIGAALLGSHLPVALDAQPAEVALLERELRELSAITGIEPPAVPGPTPAARLIGEQHPGIFASLAQRYGDALELVLRRRAYRDVASDPSVELRAVADRLGELGAGPRDVVELHSRVLRERTASAAPERVDALVAEGRLTSLELMGHLAAFYRRRAQGQPKGAGGE